MQHRVTCKFLNDRRLLITQLQAATRYDPLIVPPNVKGTEEELDQAFSVLQGVVAETCDCGVTDYLADPYSAAIADITRALCAALRAPGAMNETEHDNLDSIAALLATLDPAAAIDLDA